MAKAMARLPISLLMLGSIAWADHPEPAQAKKFQFSLISGFRECGTGNTTTSDGTPACTPPIPAVCPFTQRGSGKLTAVVTGSPTDGTQDIKLAASAKGINDCDGLPLCIELSYRYTSDDCPEGSCTTVDIEDVQLIGPPPTCCTITSGKCKIKTRLLTARPGSLPQGKNSGVELLSCGLRSMLAPIFPDDLRCGILFK